MGILVKNIEDLTAEVKQKGQALLSIEQQLAGMQSIAQKDPYNKDYINLTQQLHQAENDYEQIRAQYLDATRDLPDSDTPPTIFEIYTRPFNQLAWDLPLHLNNDARQLYENTTGASADGDTYNITPDEKLGIIDQKLTKLLVSKRVVGPLAKEILKKAGPELLKKLAEPALTETAMGLLTEAAATEILSGVLIGVGAAALGPEIVAAATILTLIHDISEGMDELEAEKKRNYERRNFAYGIVVSKDKPVSFDTDFEYVRSQEPGLPVFQKVPGQEYPEEINYTGWSADPETGQPTEMWQYTPKFMVAHTPEQQKKYEEWTANMKISRWFANPMEFPQMATEYKAPAPHTQESEMDRLSRGINLPYGDHFDGSWNATNYLQYNSSPKAAPTPQFSFLSPGAAPHAAQPGIINPVVTPVMLQAPTPKEWGAYNPNGPENKQAPLHSKPAAKTLQHKHNITPEKTLHHKTQPTQPKTHNKGSIQQSESKQGHVYNVSVNQVHGSHIKAQHITETKEHKNTTTETLAMALRSAVIANQLHAG